MVKQSENHAFICSETEASVLTSKTKRFFATKDRIFRQSLAFPLRKGIFNLHKMNSVISSLIDAGIVKHWEDQYLRKRIIEDTKQNITHMIKQQHITMKHIGSVFILLLGGLVICILCYAYEQLSH